MHILRKSELKIGTILLINLIIIAVTIYILLAPKTMSSEMSKNDYQQAFKYSIQFYDANKCGKDVALDNIFDWRGPCHTDDGYNLNRDLSGGFHDGGGHAKFGLTQGYTASILGWGLFEYRDVFDGTGNTKKMLSTLKYFTDYFLKCHTDKSTFYYQIGDDIQDFTYWGSPEKQAGKRPTQCVADRSHSASDVCGETSAALSLMYLNYKDIDSQYANKCLTAAKELYFMGKKNPGYGDRQTNYISGSFYDDLAWAALWLYEIEHNKEYLKDAEKFIIKKDRYNGDPFKNVWTLCWDNVSLACFLKLYTFTGNPIYKSALEFNLDYSMNKIKKTRGGLRYFDENGELRYVANASLLAMQLYEITKDDSLRLFAKSQIDYILGANPAKTSYIVGFKNFPKYIYHRAASGCNSLEEYKTKKPGHILVGALLSGPTEEDVFIDTLDNFIYTEVTIDYNAGLVGALASIIKSGGI